MISSDSAEAQSHPDTEHGSYMGPPPGDEPMDLAPGSALAGRFVIQRVAGWGAVGTIYQAVDGDTGEVVAIKVLRLDGPEHKERFAREIRALGELEHPAIVRFVAQGETSDGRPFVAMEWVDGHILGRTLARGPMSVANAVALTRRLGEGLAYAHMRGIVHRDINPSNLLVPNALIAETKIVDFGLVRLNEPVVTLSGTILGTPGFMAPEQVRGQTDIDARADVFALGCVLFQALTGKAPFDGDVVVRLAKVLFEGAPRARSLRPDLPWMIDDLVSRMLAQDREERPRDGSAVLEELQAMRTGAPERRLPAATPTNGVLTIVEQRFVSIVVALRHPGRSQTATADRARAAGAPFGARVELLADGTIMAALSSRGSARDQAKQAARCALALRDVIEDSPLALATGRAALGASGPIGEVIERATGLLRSRDSRRPLSSRRQHPIAIDTTTAGLLDAQFDVVGDGPHLGLRRERQSVRAEASRTLLGRPTPFVGREREMGTLEAIFRECADESAAHAVLVTASSGAGKTRLRHEFVRRVQLRDERTEIWIARGDPMSVGSPLGMIAQIVRGTAGILEGETLRTRQTKLWARLSRHLTGPDLRRICEFLGELSGIRFPETDSVQLQAARRNPVLMGDQMRRAWEDLLAAECAAQPVLLILEDLHWGDLPTVNFLDGALRNLRDQPLVVLALAQPDVHRLFPHLWEGHPMTELRLGELSRKASERLARQILDAEVDDRTIGRVVDQAAGNAFYLEELIRSVAEGVNELPPTVLAMVEARLASLDPEQRRVLRAASVFGGTFWKHGVASLLDQAEGTRSLTIQFEDLVKREFIIAREFGRFPNEFVFRHSIVREAAYGMLTEADRALGHRLAGAWLEEAGESDPMILAEQFERGAEPASAIAWYEQAATQALEGNDLGAVIERVSKGIACGASGDRKGALLVLRAEAHWWRGELESVEAASKEALAVLPRGSAGWYDAASLAISASVQLWHVEGLERLVSDLLEAPLGSAAGPARLTAWARAFVPLANGGLSTLARTLFQRIVQTVVDGNEPSLVARVHQARATEAIVGRGDVTVFLAETEAAIAAFELAGDLRSAAYQRGNAGYAKTTLGSYAAAESTLREALVSAERMGLPAVTAFVRENLGLTLAYRGALHEARAVEELAIHESSLKGETFLTAFPRAYLAEILALAGSFEAAERQAREALATVGERVGEVRMYVLGTMAHILLSRKRADAALAASTEAMQLLSGLGALPESETMVRLSHAEALHAAGRAAEAREAIRAARERLLERSERISDLALRRSFLENVPASARTLWRASEWADRVGDQTS